MKADWRVVHQVAAWCLTYPDARLRAQLGVIRSALAEQRASEPAMLLSGFAEHLQRTDPARLASDYVELFDLSRQQTLYLTYWTEGDTRRRGEVLAGFKARYRASGFRLDIGGELPDHLPVVLEYAAVADPRDGARLLQEHRASIELIRLSLVERATPYADVLTAVCGTLPGASPQDRNAAMALNRHTPPTEQVGIEPLPMPTFGGR